jgi:hypothetical protein
VVGFGLRRRRARNYADNKFGCSPDTQCGA